MGLTVSIYKNPMGDCTNRGISSMATDLCLVNVEGPTRPGPGVPAALLVQGNGNGLVKIIPAESGKNGEWVRVSGWCMMGGNYAATSDGRFHDAVRQITGGPSYGAVPIHDRIEG